MLFFHLQNIIQVLNSLRLIKNLLKLFEHNRNLNCSLNTPFNLI